MDVLAVALDSLAESRGSQIDHPLLSPRRVLGLLNELLVVDVELDVAGAHHILVAVESLSDGQHPMLQTDHVAQRILLVPPRLDVLPVEELPEGDVGLADVLRCALYFAPNTYLNRVTCDLESAAVKAHLRHPLRHHLLPVDWTTLLTWAVLLLWGVWAVWGVIWTVQVFLAVGTV